MVSLLREQWTDKLLVVPPSSSRRVLSWRTVLLRLSSRIAHHRVHGRHPAGLCR